MRNIVSVSRSLKVTVVGGGVVGLCAAYALCRRGAEVTLVERNTVGGAASSGNAGWICPSLIAPLPAPGVRTYALRSLWRPASPLFISPRFDVALAKWLWAFWRNCNLPTYQAGLGAMAPLGRRATALYDELEADGVRVEVVRHGLLFVSRDENTARRELESLKALSKYGYAIPAKPLARDALLDLEPALSPNVMSGFLLDGEWHVEPTQLTAALAERIRSLGATVLEHTEALAFTTNGHRVTRVETTKRTVDTDALIVAAGSWTGQLASLLGVGLPLQAAKGYSFTIRPNPPPARPLYLSDAKIGITPLASGVRVAGTLELSGLNERLDRRRIAAIQRAAREYLRDWPSATVEDEWVGLRPLAPDGLPIMGAIKTYANAYVSTGHGMLGVTLAPASGEAIADLVLSNKTPSILQPFAPARF